MKLQLKFLCVLTLLFNSHTLFAQPFYKNEKVLMKGIGANLSCPIVDGLIYKFEGSPTLDGLPLIVVYNAKDYKKMNEYPLKVEVPKDVRTKKARFITRGEVFYTRDGFFYVVTNIGPGPSNAELSLTNRAGEFQRSSFLICQKYSKDFRPVGPVFSLLDNSLTTDYTKTYTTQMIFNQDSTQFIILQAGEVFDGSIKFAPEKAKVLLYENSFKRIKEFTLEDYHQFKFPTVRAISFFKNTISVMINDCVDCTRGPAKIKNALAWININIQDGKATTAVEETFFSDNNLKLKYLKFIPGKSETLCMAMVSDQSLTGKPAQSTGLLLLEKKDSKIVKGQGWQMDQQTLEKPQSYAYCFDDAFGQGQLDILPIEKDKGYYIIASRDYAYCSCNGKGQKMWQYFSVGTLDPNGKFVKQKFVPIFKPEKAYQSAVANIFYKLYGPNLRIISEFSKEYYLHNKPDNEENIGGAPGVLIISPDLNTKFYEAIE